MQLVPERHSHTGQSSDDSISRPYQALLRAADLATRRGLPELLRELSARLHEVFDCDFTNYALYDAGEAYEVTAETFGTLPGQLG